MFKGTFIFSSHDSSYSLSQARLELEKEYAGELCFQFFNTNDADENPAYFEALQAACDSSGFLFMALHGGITHFKGFDTLIEKYSGQKKLFIYSGLEEENLLLLGKSGLLKQEYDEILGYYLMGGSKNSRNLLLFIASAFGCVKYDYDGAKAPAWEGIYDPLRDTTDFAEYIKALRESGKPIIVILFYSKYLHEGNLLHIDELVRGVARLGGAPLAVYSASAPNPAVGCKGLQWTIDNLLMENGLPVAEVIINNIGFAQSILANPGDGSVFVEQSIFEQLGVPVIQAMSTFNSLEGWRSSIKGLDSMSLANSIFHPEFDGQLISAPVAYTQSVKDTVGERLVFLPIEERADKICRLALNWAALRRKAPGEKKLAVILHNMPPRNDMIGCAFGLDTPQSVWNLVEALKGEGVHTEYDFADGAEIINRIIAGVSNDTRWLSVEKLLERSIDSIDGEVYREWFSRLGTPVREKMKADWGDPPGEFMVHEDRLPVPGIRNGNIFIGLQPARGFEEKAEEVYHNTDIVPPHQYIAFYRWVKQVFKADAIVHVGTHGTLEWLPGKETGLSPDCYPDIAIDDIPHLYPYIIDVPGEGIQVKRRSYGIILDHMIPSLTSSGVYDETGEMDDLIRQYYQARLGDEGKLKDLREEILETAIRHNFLKDLGIGAEDLSKDFPAFLSRLHGWVEEIKNSLIKDGLHVFGEPPREERLVNLMGALLRLPNAEVPALPEAVCAMLGMEYGRLKDLPEAVDSDGKTNYMKLDNVEEKVREVLGLLYDAGFDPARLDGVIRKAFDGSGGTAAQEGYAVANARMVQVLQFACETVKPKLCGITDEIRYFIEGVRGGFVPPGGSGCPTRGKVSILPTGRNFYSVDPAAIPTRMAWNVGVRLGDGLLQRFLKDEGRYPENVVMVVYGGETMKTCGDDIAEVLYLMGIKPKWLGKSDRVTGLEVIPTESLGRPRIDVTLRITGLFRDTFPNIIELVEEAVQLAASQEEDGEVNYLRRNIRKDFEELKNKGLSEEEATGQAGLRIFGCPPGTYGAGVDILINSRNWKDSGDLGEIYTTWGGHAYGRRVHSLKVREVFARRLAVADATVKNESSMEIDMLESDDFYNYHGGLIAAVKTHSGKMPKAYSGDSSDPSRTKIKNVNEETARIMRARILNPKWFEGLKRHGYKGAQEIAAMVDIVFGWDATSEVVEDWMYDKITENYLLNDERREWIKSVNSWAVQSMAERLLEASQRGMWNANEEILGKLKGIYLDIEGNIEEAL